MNKPKLIISDCDSSFCYTTIAVFKNDKAVTVENKPVANASQADCIICVGNTIGEATNPALLPVFNQELEERIQDHILMDYEGNQPVGTAFLLETFDEKYPFLIYASIANETNQTDENRVLFHAACSVLLAIRRHNVYSEFKIESILWPDITLSKIALTPVQCVGQLKEACDFAKAHPKLLLIPIVKKIYNHMPQA